MKPINHVAGTAIPFGAKNVDTDVIIPAHWLKTITREGLGKGAFEAIRAEEGLAAGNATDADFYKGKLQAARYFLTWEVPGCHHELAILEARDDTCLGMQDAWF